MMGSHAIALTFMRLRYHVSKGILFVENCFELVLPSSHSTLWFCITLTSLISKLVEGTLAVFLKY